MNIANFPSAGALLMSAMIATSAMGAVTTTVVDVPTRGVTKRFLYLHPDAPVANFVALPGGEGTLGIQDDGTMTSATSQCFPVARNRQAFADHGLAVALVDAASDGTTYNFSDVLEVIRYMQARDNVPTWVIGGSSSTPAISNLAVNLPIDSPVGVIFFSPALPTSQVPLINRPTLVVYHSLDPDQFGSALFAALTSAPVKERVVFTGGNNNGACGGYHLFEGIDAAFVAATTGFIDKYNASLGGGAAGSIAVEYYYDVWNFYFETSFPDEIAFLDGGGFGGAWKRTGQTFKVWPTAASNPAALPTCRFFSLIYDPKSSHFYTPYAAECASLKAGTAWQFESIAFYLQLADANGVCPPGTIPLYRAYNNGIGGAGNHRYTTNPAILDQMIAAGSVFEGHGITRVFACVPE